MGDLIEFLGGYYIGLYLLTPVLLFIGVCAATSKK